MKNRLNGLLNEGPIKKTVNTHYSVGIIVKKGPNCEPLVLVYRKRNKGTKKWIPRFPGSKQRKGEIPIDTLLRACGEKLGFSSSDAFRWIRIHTLNRVLAGEEHPQVVFLYSVSESEGDFCFRKEIKEVIDKKTGITEEWGPPEWMSLSEAMEKLLWTHRSHLLLSLPQIKRRECFSKYINFNTNKVVVSPPPKWIRWIVSPRFCARN
ncbi:MAG: NUDIX hydrolase [Candidatus Pacebacteria bacterium]|nr:NUDIX hydrolase [Candidatus Paceibacterota bacterium]